MNHVYIVAHKIENDSVFVVFNQELEFNAAVNEDFDEAGDYCS
jgi:hypothetical protein